jgi:hypothetical protein
MQVYFINEQRHPNQKGFAGRFLKLLKKRWKQRLS